MVEPLPAPRSVMIVVCLVSFFSSLGMTNSLDSSSELVWMGRLETVTEVVRAPLDSKIISLALNSGDAVDAGQQILNLDSSTLNRQIEIQQEKIRQLELELQQVEAKANVELSWRWKEIDDDIYGNKLKSADLLKEKYLADFSNVAWSELLSSQSPVQTVAAGGIRPFVHDLSVPDEVRIRAMLQQEAANNASEVYSAQMELLEKRLAELKSIRADLTEQVRNAQGIPLLQHRLKLARTEGDQLEKLRAQSEIVSPTYGIVGVFRASVGKNVRAGEPLVEILDRTQEYVTIMVRSRDLPKFQFGKEVAVIFPGEIKRQGLVSEIPPQIAEIREDGQSYSELKITPTDKSWPNLPFGSNVEISLAH
ncbi:MAG: HlyD family efflux transporter periplasmic adaptor subunit [Planctomycetaceae bacterium]|nr:HlyD family efflux transporter periplasmic adaptor subunit [Planctomycetaceae bacterium]